MNVQNEISAIVRKALAELPTAAVKPDQHGNLRISLGTQHRPLQVLWAGDGWPSDVRRIAAPNTPWPRSHVVVARRLTRSAVDWLREHDANWIDGTGLARIVTPDGILVVRQPLEATTDSGPKTQPFSWSDVRKDVAEVVLSKREVPRAAEISHETGWSSVAVAKALSSFDASGWTAKAGAARGPGAQRRLAEPQRMLDAWAEAVAAERRTTISAHATFTDAIGFLNERLALPLNRINARWAVSGWVGSQVAAPYVTSTPTLHLYVDAATFDTQLLSLLQEVQIRVVTEGARIAFWRGRQVVFAESRRYPTPLADPPRLYADLLRLGGRAIEAAQNVREQLIDY